MFGFGENGPTTRHLLDVLAPDEVLKSRQGGRGESAAVLKQVLEPGEPGLMAGVTQLLGDHDTCVGEVRDPAGPARDRPAV